MRAAGILLFASFLLAACAAPPVPRDYFYRIDVAPLAGDARPMAFDGIVSIAPFEADGLLRERPILFTSTASPQELRQHDYFYWNDAPTRLLQQSLAVYLQDSGLAETVVTPAMRIRPDFEVIGKIRRFERILGKNSQRVIAKIELAVLRPGDEGLILVKTYVVERQAKDDSVAAAVDALGQALSEIYGSFTADVSSLERAKSS